MDHLTDKEFDRVCTHLSRTFGLNMRSKRVLLDCRLSRERERLGFSSFSAYLDKVEAETDPEATARFVDLVTTHYTYFLRERRQFDFLRTTAFPELERSKPNRTWNILCAGCSTGEECYTASMIVEDYRRGRDLPPVTDAIRRRVTFAQANLNDPDALQRRYDLIMCRNVIIYFDGRTREQVLDSLYRHLAVSGYLILGHAEIIRSRTKFVYRRDSVYQKQPEAIIP